MSNELLAIAGTRRTARELVDGTIRVQIDIEPKDRKRFYELLGEVDMHVALAPLDLRNTATRLDGVTDPHVSSQPPSRPETLAAQLHRTGYFRNPKLWRALHERRIYTLQQHKQWVQQQGCIMHGKLSTHCQGDVCLHHCRSSNVPSAGRHLQPENPMKVPHWYGVPLCHEHHRGWVHGSDSKSATRADHEKLQLKAVELMAGQAKAMVKQYIGIETLADITDGMLHNFEVELYAA